MPEGDLNRHLENIVLQGGADLFGVADISPAHNIVIARKDDLASFPRAVSIGIRLSDVIVDQHSPDEKREESLYWHHVYEVVTPSLDFLAGRVCRELQVKGYRAFPVPASLPYNRETLTGVFSHKLAARLAGLGWIGKSCLLLTPEFGPRVRFATVLTAADLAPGGPDDSNCGECRICVVCCPVQAIKGKEFRTDDPLEVRFNARACAEYRHTHPCGLCVARCPVGNRRQPYPGASDNL